MSVTAPQPSGTITSTELVTSVNGVSVPAENVQRVIATTKTASGAVVDGVVVTSFPALSQSFDSVLTYPRGGNYLETTASVQIFAGAGKLMGVWVSVASATPTIKVVDSLTSTGTTILGTFTPTAGTMYRLPDIRVGTGIYVIISGTVDCTVIFDPTTT